MTPREIKRERKKFDKRSDLLARRIVFLQKRCKHSRKKKMTRNGIYLGVIKCVDCNKQWLDINGILIDRILTPSVKKGLYGRERVKEEQAKIDSELRLLLKQWKELVEKCEHPRDKKDYDYNSARDTKCLICGIIWNEYWEQVFP